MPVAGGWGTTWWVLAPCWRQAGQGQDTRGLLQPAAGAAGGWSGRPESWPAGRHPFAHTPWCLDGAGQCLPLSGLTGLTRLSLCRPQPGAAMAGTAKAQAQAQGGDSSDSDDTYAGRCRVARDGGGAAGRGMSHDLHAAAFTVCAPVSLAWVALGAHRGGSPGGAQGRQPWGCTGEAGACLQPPPSPPSTPALSPSPATCLQGRIRTTTRTPVTCRPSCCQTISWRQPHRQRTRHRVGPGQQPRREAARAGGGGGGGRHAQKNEKGNR